MKKCTKCGEEKPHEEFYKRLRGFQAWCKKCKADIRREYYIKNRDVENAQARVWQNKNRERFRHAVNTWYQKNKVQRQEETKKKVARWRKENPEKARAQREKRVAALRRATPAWLSKEQMRELALFYKNCPEGCSVNHIVPLQAKEASGLNVIWNLEYIPIAENLSRGNKFTPYTIVHGGTKK